LKHEKPFGVRKPGRRRTDEHQMADVRRVGQREVERNFTAMGTGDKSGMGDLAGTEERCKAIGFIIRFCRCRRAPVSSAVIADGMESLAESWPYLIPHSRISNTVV